MCNKAMALKGIKVVEMMGLAPGPLCGTILADFGATVTVVQKMEPNPFDVMSNGKRMISVNLKSKEGVDVVKNLCASSDVLIDTFRPGVMEKLGLGPEILMKKNSRLVYARLTGYGQSGFYRNKAGHDINYVAMSGILSMLSKDKQPPQPPVNLLSDFAGGGVLCALGIILALFERTSSGKGQIVDSSMTEGAAYVGTWLFKSKKLPIWSGEPGTNAIDGGLACYTTYKTKDGKFMAVGALEPQFYTNFLKGLELSEDEYPQMGDTDSCKTKFQEIFLSKTQEEWCNIFDKIDACVTPVLDMDLVDKHKYRASDESFYRNENLVIPEPAPKLSRTPGVSTGNKSSPAPGQHTIEVLKEIGYTKHSIEQLIKNGSVYAMRQSNL
ncbi:alpha-methylacyl-CoA racemase isoform X2 [Anticarsia gemmatalis]|uniref:alpha-methylacyl-CoA racemase isoform X2 n=1 Tax=Anticarsia gemmatalis TaxID=129554 RepID=UPI003F763321